MKRLCKEYTISTDGKFRLSYGTIDKDNPSVVFITGKTWVIPPSVCDMKDRVGNVLKDMRTTVRKAVFRRMSITDKYILDFDMKPESIVPGRKKFVSFELLVKQRNGSQNKDIKLIMSEMSDIANKIAYGLEASLNKNSFKWSD